MTKPKQSSKLNFCNVTKQSSLVGKPPLNADDKYSALELSKAICDTIEAEAANRSTTVQKLLGTPGCVVVVQFGLVRSGIRPFSIAEVFGLSRALGWTTNGLFEMAFKRSGCE